MKWEAPSEASTRTHLVYEDEAAELRDNPGKWAIIRTFPWVPLPRTKKSLGNRLANDINEGKFAAFHPKGAFRAVSRTVIDEETGKKVTNVHVRYIGENGEYDT